MKDNRSLSRSARTTCARKPVWAEAVLWLAHRLVPSGPRGPQPRGASIGSCRATCDALSQGQRNLRVHSGRPKAGSSQPAKLTCARCRAGWPGRPRRLAGTEGTAGKSRAPLPGGPVRRGGRGATSLVPGGRTDRWSGQLGMAGRRARLRLDTQGPGLGTLGSASGPGPLRPSLGIEEREEFGGDPGSPAAAPGSAAAAPGAWHHQGARGGQSGPQGPPSPSAGTSVEIQRGALRDWPA